MLRSTFAAYNEAHPEKPLIDPRSRRGTVRARDPAVVAERRLRFFAFDLHTNNGVHDDLELALRTLGSKPPTCATATTRTPRSR